MNILSAYTLKYLWLNKKRTGVTILGVILSGALICGVILLGVSFQKMVIDRAISYTGNYHAEFVDVPIKKAKYIAGNSAVKQAMFSVDLGSATFDNPNADKPYVYLFALDRLALKNQPIKLVSGRLPQSDGELLISQPMAVGSGQALQPGSPLSVTIGQRIGVDGKVVEPYSFKEDGETFTPSQAVAYTVVGVMEPPFEEYSMPAAYTAYTWLDSSRLVAGDKVNVYILARQPRNIFKTAPQIVEKAGLPEDTHIVYNTEVLTWMGVRAQDSFMKFFLTIIAIIIALVSAGSALMIFNAFSISIGERKRQFGMFSSVGATATQIRRTVITEALVIGAIGIPLGILGGIVGVGITLKLTQDIIRQLTGVEQGMQLIVSPLVIILTVLFSAGTILFAAWIPASRAARVSPIEAIRLNAEIQDGKSLCVKTNPLIRRIFGFEGELALKSLKRDRKRYRTTVLSLMISIILFVAFNALMLYTSTSAHMDNTSVNYDLLLWLSSSETKTPGVLDQILRLPEVQAYSYVRCMDGGYMASPDQLTGQAQQVLSEINALDFSQGGKTLVQTQVCSVGPTEFERYTRQLGIDPQPFAGPSQAAILINHENLHRGKLYAYDLLSLKPGDSMPVSTSSALDNVNPAEVPFSISAVTAKTPLGIGQPSTSSILIVSDSVFDAVSAALDPNDTGFKALYLKSADPNGLTEAVKQLYKAAMGSNLTAYYSMAENNQRNNMTELMVNLFFYGFLSLITLVGVTNIINTLDTNIKLRRREIAMLKSVGLTPGGLLRMLRYESLFYGLTALFYGLPLGIALSILIYFQFNGVSYFSFRLPWGAILASVAGVLLIMFATMMVSGAMIRNDNIVETIKEENL